MEDAPDVQKHWAGLHCPAKKDQVTATAEQDGTSQQLIEALQALGDEVFDGQSDVQAGLR